MAYEAADPASEARHDNLGVWLEYAHKQRGLSYEEIVAVCDDEAGKAAKIGFDQLVQDYLDIAGMARTRIELIQEGAKTGKAVSDRMAEVSARRQAMKEASLDVLEAWRDLDYDRPRPTQTQLQIRRYGEEGVTRLAEYRERQAQGPKDQGL